MRISLTPQQWVRAAEIGVRRHGMGMARSLRQKRGSGEMSKAERVIWDIRAACAEMAAGIALHAYWPATVGVIDEPDLLPDWQVRCAHQHDNRRLFVMPDDDERHRFVLVTTEDDVEFWVRGWIRGREAKDDRFKTQTQFCPECWAVPPDELRRIEVVV